MYYDANNLYGWAMSQSLLMEILDGLRGKIMKKFYRTLLSPLKNN